MIMQDYVIMIQTMHIKADDFYKDIKDDVNDWFDTSNYVSKRPGSSKEDKKAEGTKMCHKENTQITKGSV